jgi:hypothetical protein
VARIDLKRAVYLTGPAGSLTLHNCRTIHGSPKNTSDLGRPLLPLHTELRRRLSVHREPDPLDQGQAIIRGKRAQFAHHDPRPCLMPPDWSGGYTSIFDLQQKDTRETAEARM